MNRAAVMGASQKTSGTCTVNGTKILASPKTPTTGADDLAKFSRELANFREEMVERLDRLEATLTALTAVPSHWREIAERDQNTRARRDTTNASWEAAWEIYRAHFGKDPPITLYALQSDMLAELTMWLRVAVDRGMPWTAERLRLALGLKPESLDEKER